MTSAPDPNQAGVRFGQPTGGPPPTPTFGRYGSLAGIVLVLALVGGLFWAGAVRKVSLGAHPMIFGGSLVLEDDRPLTVIDVATAQVTVRLQGVDAQVGAPTYGEVQAVPVTSGTMLVDRKTGSFNLLGRNNYVVDSSGPGVGLGALPGTTGANALASGSGIYIVRHGARSTVSLVDETTVLAAARLERSSSGQTAGVSPKGFADLGGPVPDRPGSAAVKASTGDLWVLVGDRTGCNLVQLHQDPLARDGLTVNRRASFSVACDQAAVEAGTDAVAVATPGQVRLFSAALPPSGRTISFPPTSTATAFLPVTGTTSQLWFLVQSTSGWSVAGVGSAGRTLGPSSLPSLGAGADPATPVISAGDMYTLDRAASGQPDLWRIIPATGAMLHVRGLAQYPAQGPTEKAGFAGAQVIVDGPRVVYNNPGSLLAVVVFTDGSHAPVVVDKSTAVTVSATGPADLGAIASPGGNSSTPTTVAGQGAVPAVQPVSKQVTCATTTQKPYAPQINSVTVSSSTALVSWSYELLDQTDCEPDSWSVRVTALGGGHQPEQPVQTVNGQNQLLFQGLRPATTYQAVVTAYINAQSTPSPPATFTTAARGPDAPVAVSTVSDGNGNWIVSWTPCTSAGCVVPADEWNVTGSACGGSYVGQPPTVQVPGSQQSVTINSDALGLLGDSLSFSVQGSLATGLLGNPTPDRACTQAWRPPDRNSIGLTGSGEQVGQTITATLRVTTTGPPVEAFGSASTQFVYQVGGITVGPTTATTVTIPGLAAGQSYTPTVTVYPTAHPDASVTVTGQPFSKNLSWPSNLSLSVQATVNDTNPNQGSVALAFANVPPGSMSASGGYICGNTQGPQFSGALTGGTLVVPMDLVQMGGSCGVTATLSDQDASVYGRPSQPLSATFTIGTQPHYSFAASIPPECQHSFCLPQRLVVDSGSGNLDRGGNWKITTKTLGTPAGAAVDPCGSDVALSTPPVFPHPLDLPTLCLDASKVDVVVSWMYLGDTTNDDLGAPSGTPAPPPSTTTTTSTSTTTIAGAAPHAAQRSPASAFSTGGPLFVASFLGILFAGRFRTGTRRSKRDK